MYVWVAMSDRQHTVRAYYLFRCFLGTHSILQLHQDQDIEDGISR